MTNVELVKKMGYKGCSNCEYQIEPLRSCEWAERGGNGAVSFICPMWDKRGKTDKIELSTLYGIQTAGGSDNDK